MVKTVNMDNKPNAIGSFIESAGAYVETRVELLKLQAVSKSSGIISSLVSSIVIAVLIVFGLSILNIGLSIWIGTLVGEVWLGFMIVGGFYVLLAVLFMAFKDKFVKQPITNLLIKKILS